MYIDVLSHRPPPWRLAVRSFWRRRLRGGWRSGWPLLASALALAVVVLGTVGFSKTYPSDRWYDALYRAIQLFGFGGNVSGKPNAWLEIARFLGPIVVGYAAVRGILAIYRDQTRRYWRRYVLRDHVVIAGLGLAGSRLAAAFDHENWPVVVIERDPANPSIEDFRERGIGVVVGDAAAPEILRNAGVERANLLWVACGDDGANIDVAAAARTVVAKRRRGVLTAMVELADFTLWQGMKAQAFADRDEFPIRLELFNMFEFGAELLLDTHDPLRSADEPHVLIVGAGNVASSIVGDLVRRWQRSRDGGGLTITVAGPLADADRATLVRQYPGIDAVPGLELRAWNAELSTQCRLTGVPTGVTSAFVCIPKETEGLSAALTLREQPELEAATIVVVVADDHSGVGITVGRGLPAFQNIHAFGALERSLTPHALEQTTTEKIARRSHALHRAAQLARGMDDKVVEGIRPWDALQHHLRESNRLYADGIAESLGRIGCVIEPARVDAAGEPPVSLTPQEVEALAPLEHERWERAQKRIGFKHGKKRRALPFYRRHPLIDVPWDRLPEVNKEMDREHVRMMPEVLAGAGFTIRRTGRAEAERPEPARASQPAPS